MYLKSQFPEWLEIASLDGRGGYSAQIPSIVRGSPCNFRVNLATHPVFGDWTAGVFAADMRVAPDAAGSPVATFTLTVGTPSGGVTPIDFSLPVAAQSGLPADTNADGVVEILMQVDYTPPLGAATAIMQTNVLIVGSV